ncbi:MAG: spermidine/putrescine ABC transporter substrate-binding protein [Nitrospinae bacterium]|nr:spermidine/putrescine ABC transporter substrate-binding protein [Nitrospinota bacterium]
MPKPDKLTSDLTRRSFLLGIGSAASAFSFLPHRAWGTESKKLHFCNWDTYIGETTLGDFRAASGIEVKMDLFADNDELFAKLEKGNAAYDVIVPTNNYVERMITAGMLMPLDHSLIPNKTNIDPVFQDAAYDPGRRYSQPYMWGTAGVGYRKSRVEGVPDSWKWLLASDKYKGRIALMGDKSTAIQMSLKLLGHSLNTTDAALIKQVEEMLIRQKPHIKTFADDDGQDLLLSGEVDLAMEWNGDILQVMKKDADIGYVVPKEGGLLWQDCLCIPKGAPHPENAHKFINFLLRADVGAEIADFIQYATPNAAAKARMSAAYRNNPAIFPPPAVIKASEFPVYLGEEYERLIEETWARVQAA